MIHGIDDRTYNRRFTPRRPDSKWSKANKARVRAMLAVGKMTPAGMALVEAAKTAGTKKKRIERTVQLAEQGLRAYDENNQLRL